jgi:carboxyl-terminal processing protease
LTTAKYYTPSGRLIQAKGIIPDIEFKDSSAHTIRENDLPRHLPGTEDLKDKAEEGKKEEIREVVKPAKTPEEDEMVKKALDLLKGYEIFKNRQK